MVTAIFHRRIEALTTNDPKPRPMLHGLCRGSVRFGEFGLEIDDLSSVEAECERTNGENVSREEGRYQHLGQHYMNPRITPPQNRKARAATKSASFSKEI